MANNRKFTISDELFSGFSSIIDLNIMHNKQDIIDVITNNLKNKLNKIGLEMLVSKLLRCNFHIHDYEFEDILLSNKNTIFWICNHEHKKNN